MDLVLIAITLTCNKVLRMETIVKVATPTHAVREADIAKKARNGDEQPLLA